MAKHTPLPDAVHHTHTLFASCWYSPSSLIVPSVCLPDDVLLSHRMLIAGRHEVVIRDDLALFTASLCHRECPVDWHIVYELESFYEFLWSKSYDAFGSTRQHPLTAIALSSRMWWNPHQPIGRIHRMVEGYDGIAIVLDVDRFALECKSAENERKRRQKSFKRVSTKKFLTDSESRVGKWSC